MRPEGFYRWLLVRVLRLRLSLIRDAQAKIAASPVGHLMRPEREEWARKERELTGRLLALGETP